MCRLVAYLGPPLRLSVVLSETEHGLIHQSYAPREMTAGLLNADGWGVGWFPRGPDPSPGVLKGIWPIWSDENATAATHAIVSGSFVAAIRSASPGLGIAVDNTPPYASRRHLFAHNGRIWPWPGPLSRALRARVSPEEEALVRGTTDSEWFAALWRTHLGRSVSGDAAQALRTALREVVELASHHGGGITANLILADVNGFLAIRFADVGPAPSLYLSRDESRWPGGTMVASEPLDDACGWREVPAMSLVRVDGRGARTEPLWNETGRA